MQPRKYYKRQLETLRESEKKLKRKLSVFSLLRLISMVLLVYFFIRGVNTAGFYYILAGLAAILFFLFVRNYKNITDYLKKTRISIQINERELDALDGKYFNFNRGAKFLNSEHEFTYDLDIFGNNSLYQYICRCCTLNGEKILASRLLESLAGDKKIKRNQKIHEELSKNPDFMQEYLSTGLMIDEKEGESSQVISWLNNQKAGLKLFPHIAAFLMAGINTTIIIISFFVPGFINYFIISALISWFLYGSYFTPISRYHNEIGRKQEIIKKYGILSQVLRGTKFTQDFLVESEKKASTAIGHIRRLEKTMDIFDSRLNLFMGVVLNTLFLLDFHVIKSLERWKKDNRHLLMEILDIHAEIDAFISGGIFRFNNPRFIYPVMISKGLTIEGAGHPLITSGCVVNDFKLSGNENVIIITGANMAGKSTFLRTLGVNLILAGGGFPVFADKMEFQRKPIITGIRTTDSLAENESYFFAELKRLKRIMDRLRNGEKLYILLDEILKGTNSTDKHRGSEALLKQVVQYDSTFFITTHDLKLGELEKKFPEHIKNYHFESFIREDELEFDYKIREGIAKNMNASFLLKKMNILKN